MRSIPVLLLTPFVLILVAATACQAASEPVPRPNPATAPDNLRRSVFAGGCFWCLESAFEGKPGVYTVVSGYAGGEIEDPTYELISSGRTGHYEVVEVAWDPQATSYEALLEIFWTNIDPTDDGGQFCDRGPQYRSAIFASEEEEAAARSSLAEAATRLGAPIVTPVLAPARFYPAEEYHQDFWIKSPVRYTSYRRGCGRDARLEELWGAPAKN